MSKLEVVTPEQLAKADKIVVHDTPIGKVAFVVSDSLKKSYVEAHYRHTADGELVFVHGYHNKIFAKPDELKPLSEKKHEQEWQEYHQAKQKGKKVQQPSNLSDKYTSFHHGDEVFVRYSHMHDQHFGVGAVVGTRDDPHHDGKLVGVRLLDGRIEYYNPNSIVHVHKQNHDEREHEVSHHTDPQGKPIAYQHLTSDQRVKFYDLYKLFYRMYRMGEMLAFQKNKHLFVGPDGSVPSSKNDLTAEQKLKLESLNVIKSVPSEGLVEAVLQGDYDDSKHFAFTKKLAEDIEDLKKQGAPNFQFPAIHKPKSAKLPFYVPPEWLKGLYPSTLKEVKNFSDKAFQDKLKNEHTKLIENVTGLKGEPSVKGSVHGSGSDFYYGKPIVHGAVEPVTEEGTKYEKAATVPTYEQDKIQDFKEAFEAAQAIQPKADEAPKKKKTESAAEPVPVVPSVEKPSTEPQLVVQTGEGDIADLEKEFKCVANANDKGFKGAHSKYILHDSKGNEYLFKPYGDGLHRVWADIIAAKFAKAVGLPTAEMASRPIKVNVPHGLGGSYQGLEAVGSVQKIVPNLKHNSIKHWANASDLSKWKNVPKHVVEQLQKEHVMDWLLGNNDAHAAQFIVDQHGNLIGVDKGQAFKYYQQDVLSLDYDPSYNKQQGHEQVYNLMLMAAKEGHIKLDWGVVQDFIQNNLSNLSALQWVKMITPYAEHSAKWGGKNTGKFQSLASKRKANTLYDFKKLYQSAGIGTEYNVEKKKYEKAEPTPKLELPESDTFQPDAFHQIDSHFHNKVLNAGAHGYSRMIGGGDVEDMNVLFTAYQWETPKPGKTGKGMEVSLKVLPGAEANIIKWFENVVEDQTIEYVHQNTKLPLDSDPISSIVVQAAKTVNHHAPSSGGDGTYSPAKMNLFAQWFQSSEMNDANVEFDPKKGVISPELLAAKLMKGHITSHNFDDHMTLAYQVAKHYHKIASEVMEAVGKQSKTVSKMYEPWSGEYKIKKVSVSPQKFPYATFPKFRIDEHGKMVRATGEKDAQFGPHPSKFGAMFTKDLPGNIQVRYYPHYSNDLKGQNNLRGQQGQAIIDFHSWDGDVEAMHEARKVLKDMGLDHRLGTHTDMESLALTRYAWQQKANVTHKKEYEKLQQMANSPKKIEALKELCQKVYGTHPDELKTYDPTPKWDNESGHHHFWNPWVLQHLHYDNPEKVKILTHQLTATKGDDALENLAKHGLMSIEGRHKFGWYDYKGMSPDRDQRTGGSAYVGLSSTQKPKGNLFNGVDAGNLVFRPELYARSDAYGFSGDAFGTTHEKKGMEHVSSSVHDRMPIMDIVKSPDHLYEVRFKWRVPLDKWFIGVKAENTGYGASSKVIKGWVQKFKSYLKQHRPHILNHAQFIGIKD
jgi:hypothetical protein